MSDDNKKLAKELEKAAADIYKDGSIDELVRLARKAAKALRTIGIH